MYQRFYSLRELPFELTSNPKYLYLTAKHREALSNLEYGLSVAKSLTVLIGEAGTGKTTLLRAALESERCAEVRCVYLNNPALTRGEFLAMLASRFSLSHDASRSKTSLLDELERVLRERRARGEITALVVDEAQALSTELLEEIRLLANIETPEQKLLPLVLAGQPELADRLEEPSLRQLKQRVALRCDIAPFELPETAAYIATRIKTAGGVPSKLFSREGVVLIHEYSAGIPRTISVICDNALVSGMALDRQPVDRAIVMEVCRDFHLRRQSSAQGADTERERPAESDERPHDTTAPAGAGEEPASSTADAPMKRRFTLFGSGRTSV
jgi:type II secretory pathway predicted ATPase ExeA